VTFEEMLEMASLGSKVSADPVGGVRRQVQSAASGSVQSSMMSLEEEAKSGTLITVEEDKQHGTGNHLRHCVQP
jgi:aspartate kinase